MDDTAELQEPIAVIGMACRFPGAVDCDSFWKLLDSGRESVAEIPDSRVDVQTPARRGGFLANVDEFDADFFSICAAEAVSLDPQHRLLLETAWQALEDAGYSDQQLMGSSCGVYLGLCNRDYEKLVDPGSAWSGTGNAFSLAAGRISYHLGLKGPSLTLDTASSSSLVAIHQACQSLRAGDCCVALAGGANLMLTPEVSLYMKHLGALSPEGRSKVFDAAADGYVRSEGCGLVVLKPLSQARADNDQILALVRGGSLNQDGRSQTLTSPDGDSQEALLLEAWRQAGIRWSLVDGPSLNG